MNEPLFTPVDPEGIRRFLFEGAGVRGVIVRLEHSWRQILDRDQYPKNVAQLLGELTAATALFAGDIQFAGHVSVQMKASPLLPLVFAECTAESHMRGLARWGEGAGDSSLAPDALAGAVLAITIERQENGVRYQGLVPLQGDRLARSFEAYFAQSEQLPTTIHLAANASTCAGVLIQQIPAEGGIERERDAITFEHAKILADTLAVEELLTLDARELLRRLYHEDDLRLFDAQPVRFQCRCSRERVAAMLRTLGREESFAVLAERGQVAVICEFCNEPYAFDGIDLEQVFASATLNAAPQRAQ
ncbi:MAG: Hsp33 family molecular chaperone HslO [Xanthomonadales bacterium]|nr:Hsp33 family molecular chaperone HslO [Xanthomonadales bacterium]MCC6559733.1 Hsp33 family molecular chaperone HslO [Xanthomonadales bacterium]